MDTNLSDALSGLLLLSSDSNNDSNDGSMTHIPFSGFSILFVCHAHAPLSRPSTSWLLPSSRSSSSVSAALSDLPPLVIRCPRQSAAVGNLLPLAIRRCADTSSPCSISPRRASRRSQSHRTINPRSRFPDYGGTALAAGIRSSIAFIGPQDVVGATKTATAAVHPFGLPDCFQIRCQRQSQRQHGGDRCRPAL